ncbi:MAG: DUF5597 domain-containing protein [Opitutales bacterium]|nr:DUF5597 domain-containing protein [Opitutales bacterium]
MKKYLAGAGALSLAFSITVSGESIPYLDYSQGTKLMVNEIPFFIRGGETGNSTVSDRAYMGQYWDKLQAMNLNTLVIPAYWELLEPEEGQFDFSLIDGLIEDARAHDMHLVFLWFGSWKNSMSCYAPGWVKTDSERFPRARDAQGNALEILSPFSERNLEADRKAFTAFMEHLKETDHEANTVLMVQVENEIGMIPCARDHSKSADKAFYSPVPESLLQYLAQHKESLMPHLYQLWQSQGFRHEGTWIDVFGDSDTTEELFMAWYFAEYVEKIASSGKAAYPLPMYANAALIRPGYRPGQYPAAGPLPHLADIWRAAAPNLDFIAPDIYFPNFTEWTRAYAESGNPLFIPEALRSSYASVNALYAFGEHNALGFSPFGIESIEDKAGQRLAESYALLEQLEPLMIQHWGKPSMIGLLKESPEHKREERIRLGDFQLNVTYEESEPPALADGVIFHEQRSAPEVKPAGGLVIQTAPNEFIFAGTGLIITFDALNGETVGILSAEEGRFEHGTWVTEVRMNGDQTHQGRHIRLVPGKFSLQKVKIYTYK